MGARDVLRGASSAAQHAREAERPFDIYSPRLDHEHRRRFGILAGIPAALAAPDQLRLVYQPRLDVRSGTCVAVEALLRWRHPELGEISPGEFMPLVEQTAHIRDVTDWVVRAAMAQASEWRDAGIEIRVSINISSANLEEEDFATGLLDLIRQNGLAADAIELELTESALIRNGRRALQQLHQVNEAGVRIAIDDFGTGYSSLSYLQQIPASVLKIDRSFMFELERDERARTLVSAMISMAQDLQYRVVAEGVETGAVFDLLAGMGCDEIQGYLISRPLPAADLQSRLAERSQASPRQFMKRIG